MHFNLTVSFNSTTVLWGEDHISAGADCSTTPTSQQLSVQFCSQVRIITTLHAYNNNLSVTSRTDADSIVFYYASLHISNYYYYYDRFTALCPGLPRSAGTRRNIHPRTYPDHHPTFISFFHLLRSTASSLFNLRAWQSFFAQPLSESSLVYLLVWSPPPHTSYIISTNQCRLFATHAHTITACFAVVLRWYHLFLVSLS